MFRRINASAVNQRSVLMNAFFVCAIQLFALGAFAWPTLGDEVQYDVLMERGGQSSSGTMSIRVVSIDAARNQLNLQYDISISGQNHRQASSSNLTDAQNLANNIQSILANCQAFGGQNETVVTATGVSLPSCKMPVSQSNSQGWAWIADVKFGMAKTITTSNGVTSTLLFRAQN